MLKTSTASAMSPHLLRDRNDLLVPQVSCGAAVSLKASLSQYTGEHALGEQGWGLVLLLLLILHTFLQCSWSLFLQCEIRRTQSKSLRVMIELNKAAKCLAQSRCSVKAWTLLLLLPALSKRKS